MDDLLKKIETIEKRMAELEKKSNLSMFGRSYSQIGDSNSDFLIKTRGQVKIQWGSKFIDLIKDGKINTNSNFIYQVATKSKIGSKDGIYITKDDGFIYLQSGGTLIPLLGEVGTTYVSFLEGQETQSDSKYNALKNIGFLYPDLSSINDDSLKNGIIYIESEQKLYIVKDGALTEFTISFPNPFTEQFIIQKNDSQKGSLLIKGSGILNSLAFDSLYLFTEGDDSFIRSEGVLNILLGNDTYLKLEKNQTIINNKVVSNTFQSSDSTYDRGFSLVSNDDGSTLTVDYLRVRKPSNTIQTSIYPTYWSSGNNIVTQVSETESNKYSITLKYLSTYSIGDTLYLYGDISDDNSNLKIVKVPVVVDSSADSTIQVSVLTDSLEEPLSRLPDYTGKIVFPVKDNLIRYSKSDIDIINNDSIEARYGDLNNLQLFEKINNVDTPISGFGQYSKQAYFTKVGYEKNYSLPENDNSTNLASTEWIRRMVSSVLPVGTIVAYHGSTIPQGWKLCNGENGTPNLIGKFIKAGSAEGTGGSNEITLKPTNIPRIDVNLALTLGDYLNKQIPTFDTLEEFCTDRGGDNNFCLYTGNKQGESGLKGLPMKELSSIFSINSAGSTTPENINIEPEYYSLVFIMKVE